MVQPHKITTAAENLSTHLGIATLIACNYTQLDMEIVMSFFLFGACACVGGVRVCVGACVCGCVCVWGGCVWVRVCVGAGVCVGGGGGGGVGCGVHKWDAVMAHTLHTECSVWCVDGPCVCVCVCVCVLYPAACQVVMCVRVVVWRGPPARARALRVCRRCPCWLAVRSA